MLLTFFFAPALNPSPNSLVFDWPVLIIVYTRCPLIYTHYKPIELIL
jgi:hypothetical protein